jgi:hypothetical protein
LGFRVGGFEFGSGSGSGSGFEFGSGSGFGCGFGFRGSGISFRVSGDRVQGSGCMVYSVGYTSRVYDCGVSGSGFRAQSIRPRVVGVRVKNSGFQSSGFTFLVSPGTQCIRRTLMNIYPHSEVVASPRKKEFRI